MFRIRSLNFRSYRCHLHGVAINGDGLFGCRDNVGASRSREVLRQALRWARLWFPPRARAQPTSVMESGMTMSYLSCPLPLRASERILLAHGGGGRLTNQLIEDIFLPAFSNPALDARHDGALLSYGALLANGAQLAMTTDSYVVQPLIFPGGTIGDLAVNGTVNDLAMCGARPLALSAAFILEEGLPMETLRSVVKSMSKAAQDAHVPIVTGDTKVVDRGKGDGVFISTTGVGVVVAPRPIGPQEIRKGDAVLVSGSLGAHGIAILSVREGLAFEGPVVSDTARSGCRCGQSLQQASTSIACGILPEVA